jgi:hypothetical protein
MTFYYKKSVPDSTDIEKSWTQKHEEFCLENGFRPPAKLLWQWLISHGNLGTETEPDLLDFNKWVARHRGKGYCPKTLKDALKKLIECRVVNLLKKYTWRIVKIVTRPIEWLIPRKNLRNPDKIFTLPTSNPQLSDTDSRQQQQSSDSPNIDKNLATLQNAGINFHQKNREVLDRPLVEIQLSLILFEQRGGFEKARNPEGWIVDCLKGRYWEEPRNEQTLLGHLGNLNIWDEWDKLDLFADGCYQPVTS